MPLGAGQGRRPGQACAPRAPGSDRGQKRQALAGTGRHQQAPTAGELNVGWLPRPQLRLPQQQLARQAPPLAHPPQVMPVQHACQGRDGAVIIDCMPAGQQGPTPHLLLQPQERNRGRLQAPPPLQLRTFWRIRAQHHRMPQLWQLVPAAARRRRMAQTAVMRGGRTLQRQALLQLIDPQWHSPNGAQHVNK